MMIGLLRRIRYRSKVVPWWESQPTFEFAGNVFKLFVSNHNCGWPPARMTERAVELPLADRWLETVDATRVIEIGAVTPYYWPRRVPHVVDPFDPHPLVTTRASLFDVDLSGAPVLSISTLEHVGVNDYGLTVDYALVEKAFRKVFRESLSFLITAPVGYNETMDRFLFENDLLRDGIVVRYLVRSALGNDWREETDPARARLPYLRGAELRRSWANCVVVVSRGAFL
ncbi:MAG: hypothetical protein ACLQIB_39240 [Isosphaeraceae bacterium]